MSSSGHKTAGAPSVECFSVVILIYLPVSRDKCGPSTFALHDVS